MASAINTTDLTPLPERPNLGDYERLAGEGAEARLKLAQEHGFASWDAFAEHRGVPFAFTRRMPSRG